MVAGFSVLRSTATVHFNPWKVQRSADQINTHTHILSVCAIFAWFFTRSAIKYSNVFELSELNHATYEMFRKKCVLDTSSKKMKSSDCGGQMFEKLLKLHQREINETNHGT